MAEKRGSLSMMRLTRPSPAIKSGGRASSSPPSPRSEVKMLREELLREMRALSQEVQGMSEAIRWQTQHLLRELRHEMHGERNPNNAWQSTSLFTPTHLGNKNVARQSSGNVSRPRACPDLPVFEPELGPKSGVRWMPKMMGPESEIKDERPDSSSSGCCTTTACSLTRPGTSGSIVFLGQPSPTNRGGTPTHRPRKNINEILSAEAHDDPWMMPLAEGSTRPGVGPPLLPFEVPMPPPEPPQVEECNGDAGGMNRRSQPRKGSGFVQFESTSDSDQDDRGSLASHFLKDDLLTPTRRSCSSSECSDPLARRRYKKQMTRRLSLGIAAARKSRREKGTVGRSQKRQPLCSMSAKDILKSSRFDNLMGMLILFNAVVIGIQTDYASRHLTDTFPSTFRYFEVSFCIIFTFELGLRIYVHRSNFFWRRQLSILWNYFDLFIVAAQLLEEGLLVAASSSGLELSSFRLLRILRVLRLVRIFRVIRVLHLISELRTIISSIMGSFRSLGWTCVLLFLMIYIVGVYFTQSITDYMVEKNTEGVAITNADNTLRYYFGDLLRAILTLWQAMSGGIDWDSLAGPLISINILLGMAFASYIAFALLALMNVVTGVFVQTALQNAKDEEDAFLTDQIINLFERCDVGKAVSITLDEINDRLHDPDMSGEWKAINVSPEEARYLFELLDIDRKGEIAFEEFLSGCLRLHGTAKSVDLLTVMQECRSEFRSWHGFLSKWEEHLQLCESIWDDEKRMFEALGAQIQANNQILRHFVRSAEGLDQSAEMHKDAIQRFEQKLRPVEKSFDVVKKMMRSPEGLETLLEAITISGPLGRAHEHWPRLTKSDEV
uniref:EF-hand domain-containing protein n=1 Tax=Alexandrium monilatum TaxID=311494 RepID=A0A7S4UQF2_9DINO|mmetsp:Transcript_16258/g.50869  ORF Transcript_16258/g.50869 Transcript_16258/m.50869 type:complete len:837 (-) Transcript_16258:19-2529(-)